MRKDRYLTITIDLHRLGRRLKNKGYWIKVKDLAYEMGVSAKTAGRILVAFLASHIMWWTTPDKLKILYDMITWRAAKAMGIRDYCKEVTKGCKADLLVHNYQTLRELLLNHESPRYVIKNGKVIVENSFEIKIK